MRIVLDTNVFVSGVFFSGPPYEILRAWSHGKVQIVMSEEILEEYRRVGEQLSEQFPEVDLEPMLALLVTEGHFCLPTELPGPVCDDPDDDKFLACALAGKVKVIVSGDKHLLKVSGYRGIDVLRPRKFLDQYMRRGNRGGVDCGDFDLKRYSSVSTVLQRTKAEISKAGKLKQRVEKQKTILTKSQP